MENTKEKLLPGTAAAHNAHGEKDFTRIEILLEATGGLSLSQVCAVTGLEGSTIQNWVKRGWVAHPKGKKYEEVHIARILIINALKECIKLEYIAQLMVYVNGETEDISSDLIRECELYNYLCSALQQIGQAEDLSRSGVESVVETVIKDYEGPTPYARYKIRKALALMIYACVCTDVKRRTEAMMLEVLNEIENPQAYAEDAAVLAIVPPISNQDDASKSVANAPPEEIDTVKPEPRKTVAQAIREWDLTRVEDILNEENEDENISEIASSGDSKETAIQQPDAKKEKPAQKPWYFRRN